MARKSTSTKGAKIPGARRTLFFKYGDQIFRPHFALALQYREALMLSRGEENVYELMWGDGRVCKGTAPFVRLHKRVEALAIVDGPEVIIQIGSLLLQIAECETAPVSKDRTDIMSAYLSFFTEFMRPPAREELRRNLWLPRAVPAAKRKVGRQDKHAVEELLRSVWRDQTNELGQIMELNRFKRAIRDTGLELFKDGGLLERYRKRYKGLQDKLGRKPTKDEFLHYTRSLTARARKPLQETTLQDFIDFLANPFVSDPFAGWGDVSWLRKMITQYLDKNASSKKQASEAFLLFDGITHLGRALGVLGIGLLEGQDEDWPELKTLSQEYSRLAVELNRLPWLEDILIKCDSGTLALIASELDPDPEIEAILLRIKNVLRGQKFPAGVTVAWLIDEMPGMRLLTQGFERLWMDFWPKILLTELEVG